jgi:hypothetical protein
MSSTAVPAENAAEAEAGAPRRRWRLQIPTSVLVTSLVAALSVWVAPAFTRQSEDGKQARQLQAQLAEQIALASADLAHRLNSLARAGEIPLHRVSEQSQSVRDYWEIRQAPIEAKLRAYFSQEMRSQWLTFDNIVKREVTLFKFAKFASAVPSNSSTAHAYRSAASDELSRITPLTRSIGVEPPFTQKEAREFSIGDLKSPLGRLATLSLITWMREVADTIIDRLLTEDPGAFSTTRQDLLRDLLP